MKHNPQSIGPFINSFIREYSHLVNFEENRIVINLENQILAVSVLKFSVLGNHIYDGKMFVERAGIIKEIDFYEFVNTLCSCLNLNNESFKEFVIRSFEKSNQYIFENIHDDSKEKLNYLHSEQALYLGHPIHPFPKARVGFSEADEEVYSPENKNSFNLIWCAVHKSILLLKSSNNTLNAYSDLADFENLNFDKNLIENEGYEILPFHPWQFNILKNKSLIKKYLDKKLMINLCLGKNAWSSTSSVRSIYNEKAPWLLKYSLSLKITNSVRHLTLKESVRGLEVSKIVETKEMKEYFEHNPALEIMLEPSFYALLNENGECIEESVCVVRENRVENDESFQLLSFLNELNFKTNEPNIQNFLGNDDLFICTKRWFESFLSNCIGPILSLASEKGILLGAHMQNIILKLENGAVTKSVFKDCQGTGYTKNGFAKFKDSASLAIENGNILDEENINKIFHYYIVINTTFSTISALANNDNYMEEYLLTMFRNFVFDMNQNSKNSDKSIFDFILNSKNLFQKSNFKCSLELLNENTMEDPSTLYHEISNPIANLRPIVKKHEDVLKKKKLSFLKKEISIRSLNLEKDLETFWQWQNKEYVSHFWELNQTKNELRSYLIEIINSPYKEAVIFEVEGESVGYFELYWVFEDRIAPFARPDKFDRGIHLLFGEEKYLATRYIPEALILACEYMFESDERTKSIWGEPRHDNKNIMKLVKFLPGWKFIKEFDFPHKRAALIQCPREEFYLDLSRCKK